ncbi:MAG: EAL domain-containing protein [Azospirillum sp.]|nr:EAL domain-containing protein [Azospirillum sp.]
MNQLSGRASIHSILGSGVLNIFESLRIGIQTFDVGPDSQLILRSANASADRILGVDHRDLIGRPIELVLPGLAGSPLLKELLSVVEYGTNLITESIPYQTEGVQCSFEVHAFKFAETGLIVALVETTEHDRRDLTLRRLSEAVEQSPVITMITDPHGEIVYANRRFSEITGYGVGTLGGGDSSEVGWQELFPEFVNQATVDSIADIFAAEDRERFRERGWSHVVRTGLLESLDLALITHDGRSMPIQLAGSVLYDAQGGLQNLVFVASDRQAQETLRKFSLVVEQSPISVMITDLNGRIEFVNRKFSEVTGFSSDEAIGQNPSMVASGHTPTAVYADLWQTISAGGEWSGELLNRKKNGDLLWEYVLICPIKAEDGHTTHYLGIKEDITIRKLYEEKLLHQANFDALTSLPNRVLAFDRLNQALIRAQRSKRSVGVLFVDIDHFKQVNDTLGHGIGDELLCQAGRRLQNSLRASDTVARFGGDEFLIVLNELPDPIDAESVAQKILAAFADPFCLNREEVFASVSIGIAIAPFDGSDAQVLMRNADAAMYQAKSDGRAAFRFFTTEQNERAHRRLMIDSHLRRALEHDELSLAYQPQMRIADRALIGAEVLLRWNCAKLGSVPPDQFIPIAEETGLIEPIGDWIIEESLRQYAIWLNAGVDLPSLAINVSARQFRDRRLAQRVADALARYGIPPRRIEVEITERLLIDDKPATRTLLMNFAEMGMRLCLDDFGTGYSSLSYLRRFPVSTLKIDRSFVADMTTNRETAAVTEGLIALAHRLGITVIAEGVETIEQLRLLELQQCNQAQGFLLGQPVAAAHFPTDPASWSLVTSQLAWSDRLAADHKASEPCDREPGP